MVLSMSLDGSQPRVKRGRVAAFAQGGYPAIGGGFVPGWSDVLGEDTFFDKATCSLMLRPYCLSSTWVTSSTAPYDKLGIASFTLSPSSDWDANDVLGNGALVFMHQGSNATPKSGVSTSSYAKNRGIFASFFGYGVGSDREQPIFAVGWNASADTSSGVWVQIYSEGKAEVIKGGEVVGKYSIRGKRGDEPGNPQGYTDLILIPGRHRELIVICPTTGGSFSHAFEDIADTDPHPVITPAGPIAFIVPTGTATVLVTPLKFPTTGWGASEQVGLAEDPTGLAYEVLQYADIPDGRPETDVIYTLVSPDDATTAYSFGSHGLLARIRVAITGDGAWTPCVHAALIDFTPEVVDTPAAPFDMRPFAEDWTIDVPEDAGGVKVTWSTREPQRLEEEFGLDRPRTLGNRPFLLSLGGAEVIKGAATVPEFEFAAFPEAGRLHWEARDEWWKLEATRFRDPMPLDGRTLKAALQAVLSVAGIGAGRTDIYDDGFTLPRGPSPSLGDWAALIDVGDDGTCAQWIRRLFETFAGDWIYNIRPTATGPVFWARPPEGLSLAPVARLYPTVEAARDAGHTSHPERHVWRSYRESPLEPEANEIRITGWDARRRRPFQVFWEDEASKDPSLASTARPDNHLGCPREVAYLEPMIVNEDVGERMINRLIPRLATIRRPAEWRSELIVYESAGVPLPAWPGDCVELVDLGTYRINTLSSRIVIDRAHESEGWQSRQTTYTGELI